MFSSDDAKPPVYATTPEKTELFENGATGEFCHFHVNKPCFQNVVIEKRNFSEVVILCRDEKRCLNVSRVSSQR